MVKSEPDKPNRRYITEMDADEVRAFFLKPSSFAPLDLPSYYKFDKVLEIANTELSSHSLIDLATSKISLSNTEDVNYTLLLNKDARYDWRPIQIIHPLAYVDLVNCVCNYWPEIQKRFELFQRNPKLKCISMPVESTGKKSDKEEVILNWWENLEQASIKHALDYQYCIKTDITNCYGSIYTHTISWALNGKDVAKQNRRKGNAGNDIDKRIEFMQYGQTNGIPQGGSVFDMIAELVLGYSDLKMNEWFDYLSQDDYQIIRYRDDYRIFTNSKGFAEEIVRHLSDVLADLNMHFNSKKTAITTDIIGSAVKPAKLFWTAKQPIIQMKLGKDIVYHLGLQKHLWQIYELSNKFPNSGTVTVALNGFLTRLLISKTNVSSGYQQLISIIVSIIVKSPNSIPVGVSILSHLFTQFGDQSEAIAIINSVIKKVQNIPNIGFTEIWLQRLSLLIDKDKPYHNVLCQKVYSDKLIWNSGWCKKAFDESSIIDYDAIDRLTTIIPQEEVALFTEYPFA